MPAKSPTLLRALANERRLMILCKLVEGGEATVGALAETVGLSQSALSQHLAKMREEGLVAFRRESQTLWYRIADPDVRAAARDPAPLYCQDRPGREGIIVLPTITPAAPSACSTMEPR